MNDALYDAFKAHDARFDGRVFICVSSTGIYCRPVCRVKTPKKENCAFHMSAASAEAAGYRPCRKCRPELAPGLAPTDSGSRLARKAALAMDADCLRDSCLVELADMFGVSDRHLRRVFSDEFGVPPVQYLQTRRLLLAKNLLTDTELSVTKIAMASGFGSVRRFNHLFTTRYKFSPTELRRHSQKKQVRDESGVTVHIGYRPPYRWDALSAFLAGRSIPGVECVENGAYMRTVVVPDGGGRVCRGWISVARAEKKNALAVTVPSSLVPVLPKVLGRVRNLFDTDCEPETVYAALSVMNEMRPGLCVPGTRLPGCFDAFEMAVRAVLGQQITVKAARTLAGRFARAFGEAIETPHAALTHNFPTPETVLALPGTVESHLGPLGIIGARARSIAALAEAMASGKVNLSPLADPEEEMEKLQALPGFGPWTARYIAMRSLSWPDAFPHTDYGVKKALDDMPAAKMLALAEQWRPWRSYATINLWNSLST